MLVFAAGQVRGYVESLAAEQKAVKSRTNFHMKKAIRVKVAQKEKGLAGTNRLTLMKYGRGEMIRTSDPLVPNQMRYQAALRPDMRAL